MSWMLLLPERYSHGLDIWVVINVGPEVKDTSFICFMSYITVSRDIGWSE